MLTLSTDVHRRLEHTLRVCVSPLDYASTEAWLLDAMRAVRELLGADRAIGVHPNAGRTTLVGETDDHPAVDAYTQYYQYLPHGFQGRRRQLRLAVSQVTDLYEDYHGHRRSEFYNDFSARYGLLGGLALTVDLDDGPLGMLLYRDIDVIDDRVRQPLALLGLVYPAFQAGVRAIQAAGQHRAALLASLDQIPAGILAYDVNGTLAHANRAILQMETDDPEFHDCYAAARQLTQHGRLDCQRRIQTRVTGYTLSLNRPTAAVDHLGLTLIFVQRDLLLTDTILHARFGLTPRECVVARLLMEGRSNKEVAQTLSISEHTSRHHAERVLRKIGVHSRAEVPAALQGVHRPG